MGALLKDTVHRNDICGIFQRCIFMIAHYESITCKMCISLLMD